MAIRIVYFACVKKEYSIKRINKSKGGLTAYLYFTVDLPQSYFISCFNSASILILANIKDVSKKSRLLSSCLF